MAYKAVLDGLGKQVYGALPLAAINELDRHARTMHMSRSQAITVILLDYLAANKKKLVAGEEKLKEWQ
jgi:hypothetical protein